MKGLLVIISAPSGAGKTTIVRELVNRMSAAYIIEQLITYTSRPLTSTEKNGIDYHWLPPKEFEEKIQEGFFLEWSTAYGNYYGTPRTLLDRIALGVIVVVILDRLGAKKLKSLIPEALTVWLTVPTEVLRERLERRKRDRQEQIENRLLLAKKEFEEEKETPFYKYSIENSDKESTIRALESIIVNLMNNAIQSRIRRR